MAAQFFDSQPQFTTTTGKPLNGGKVFTYANGTTTNQDTWKEVGLSNLNTNPIILDANGRFPFGVFANDSDIFTILIKDANDVVIYPSKDDQSFSGEFSLDSADVLAALASNSLAVVINGSEISGTAFQSFADALTLSAAGSIDATAGSINLGTVTGNTIFAGVSVATDFLNISDGPTLAVSAGSITVTQTAHFVDTEGGAATDDLDNIYGGSTGDIIILSSVDNARDVTVTQVGNIRVDGSSVTLLNFDARLTLKKLGSFWFQIAFSAG